MKPSPPAFLAEFIRGLEKERLILGRMTPHVAAPSIGAVGKGYGVVGTGHVLNLFPVANRYELVLDAARRLAAANAGLGVRELKFKPGDSSPRAIQLYYVERHGRARRAP